MREIASLICVLIVISCKKKLEANQFITFSLDIIVTQDDSFQLFYSNDFINEFKEENSVKVKVKGSKKTQTISFKLQNSINPNRIRIDLGNNTAQKFLIIKNLKIIIDKNQIVIEKRFFNDLFKSNEFILNKTNENIFYLKTSNKIYDPYIISKSLVRYNNRLIRM